MDEQHKQVIFQAVNHHSSSVGLPPHINTAIAGRYYGYFENEHKEQFVFVYEHDTNRASLWLGDNGWETPVSVIEGDAPTMMLSKAEKLWLAACWMAATEFEK